MRWMTKLDRALCDMAVRAARAGGEEARRVREVVAGVLRLDPQRLTSYFHVGFAEALLGLDPSELSMPPANEARDRWYAFGKLVALTREHRHEEAAALASSEVSLRLARDPQIGPEAVPLACDALLRVGSLGQAVELAWAYVRPEPDNVDSSAGWCARRSTGCHPARARAAAACQPDASGRPPAGVRAGLPAAPGRREPRRRWVRCGRWSRTAWAGGGSVRVRRRGGRNCGRRTSSSPTTRCAVAGACVRWPAAGPRGRPAPRTAVRPSAPCARGPGASRTLRRTAR